MPRVRVNSRRHRVQRILQLTTITSEEQSSSTVQCSKIATTSTEMSVFQSSQKSEECCARNVVPCTRQHGAPVIPGNHGRGDLFAPIVTHHLGEDPHSETRPLCQPPRLLPPPHVQLTLVQLTLLRPSYTCRRLASSTQRASP